MNRYAIKIAAAFSLIVLVLPCICSAQGSNVQGARKFDEFGDIYVTDIKARLDNFAIQLQQEPGTRGFIIIYRARRDLAGLNDRLAGRMRDYLMNNRGISADRIVTINGGVAYCLTQELWMVPIGAAPTPRSDALTNLFIDTDSAWKFDEYYFPLTEVYDEGDESAGNSLEAFAEALRNYPKALAYIVAYPQHGAGRRSDPATTSARMLKSMKGDLVSRYNIAASRIRLMNGGYRKQRQIELWIVPRGEHAPIPTPNAFPKKRR